MPRKTNAQLTLEESENNWQLQENTPEEELSAETSEENNSADIEQESPPAIPLMLSSPEAEPEQHEAELALLESFDATQESEAAPPEPLDIPQTSEKPAPEGAAQSKAKPELEKPKRKSARKTTDKAADKPVSARSAFYQLDFRELDRNLSPEQEQEWNSIYASYRSGSILTGTISGVDENTFDITGENGKTERRTVRSLVVIGYRVKVLIPETEVWMADDEKPSYVTRSMVGSQIDYVIMDVDRVSECAIASRRMALVKRRRHFNVSAGELTKCTVLVVGAKRLLAACGGFDLILTQRDLSYTAIADLRTEYKTGQKLTARLLDTKDGKPVISVKEVNPNPFDGAEQRHPVDSRRQAVIEGKYAGGVFCRLPDGVTCLCLYSNNHFDTEFYTGDRVLIHITRFDYNRKLVYARIISKW